MNSIASKWKENTPYVAFDLDGTLAEYHGWSDEIGSPIKPMVDLLMQYVNRGVRVKIFTARANQSEQINIIKQWLSNNNLPDLEITCTKDYLMDHFYDDRAIRVEYNTGRILGVNGGFQNVHK